MDYCPKCNRLKLLSDGECKYCTGPWRNEKPKPNYTCQTCGKFCRGKQCYDCFVNRWGERKKPILSPEAIELKKKVNEKRNLKRKEERKQKQIQNQKLKELADLIKRQEERKLKRRLEYQKRKDESNNQSRRRLNKELKTTRKTPRSRKITKGVSKKQESQSLTR